ncbi:MAG: zinc ribbon domain-containing protein [Betaproteobacteria bacterium]
MPIYEYRCGACGFQQEILQKLSDAPLKDCPECGKPSMSKMVTAAGFQLKGSGWYATDFKHGSSAKAKPADQAEAKADDKPAAPAKAKPATETAADKSTDKSTAKAEAPVAKATPVTTPAANS